MEHLVLLAVEDSEIPSPILILFLNCSDRGPRGFGFVWRFRVLDQIRLKELICDGQAGVE